MTKETTQRIALNSPRLGIERERLPVALHRVVDTKAVRFQSHPNSHAAGWTDFTINTAKVLNIRSTIYHELGHWLDGLLINERGQGWIREWQKAFESHLQLPGVPLLSGLDHSEGFATAVQYYMEYGQRLAYQDFPNIAKLLEKLGFRPRNATE